MLPLSLLRSQSQGTKTKINFPYPEDLDNCHRWYWSRVAHESDGGGWVMHSFDWTVSSEQEQIGPSKIHVLHYNMPREHLPEPKVQQCHCLSWKCCQRISVPEFWHCHGQCLLLQPQVVVGGGDLCLTLC